MMCRNIRNFVLIAMCAVAYPLQAQDMLCEALPDCTDLGYELTVTCSEAETLACPYDTRYKKCVNPSCETLGFTKADKTKWCKNIITCSTDASYTLCAEGCGKICPSESSIDPSCQYGRTSVDTDGCGNTCYRCNICPEDEQTGYTTAALSCTSSQYALVKLTSHCGAPDEKYLCADCPMGMKAPYTNSFKCVCDSTQGYTTSCPVHAVCQGTASIFGPCQRVEGCQEGYKLDSEGNCVTDNCPVGSIDRLNIAGQENMYSCQTTGSGLECCTCVAYDDCDSSYNYDYSADLPEHAKCNDCYASCTKRTIRTDGTCAVSYDYKVVKCETGYTWNGSSCDKDCTATCTSEGYKDQESGVDTYCYNLSTPEVCGKTCYTEGSKKACSELSTGSVTYFNSASDAAGTNSCYKYDSQTVCAGTCYTRGAAKTCNELNSSWYDQTTASQNGTYNISPVTSACRDDCYKRDGEACNDVCGEGDFTDFTYMTEAEASANGVYETSFKQMCNNNYCYKRGAEICNDVCGEGDFTDFTYMTEAEASANGVYETSFKQMCNNNYCYKRGVCNNEIGYFVTEQECEDDMASPYAVCKEINGCWIFDKDECDNAKGYYETMPTGATGRKDGMCYIPTGCDTENGYASDVSNYNYHNFGSTPYTFNKRTGNNVSSVTCYKTDGCKSRFYSTYVYPMSTWNDRYDGCIDWEDRDTFGGITCVRASTDTCATGKVSENECSTANFTSCGSVGDLTCGTCNVPEDCDQYTDNTSTKWIVSQSDTWNASANITKCKNDFNLYPSQTTATCGGIKYRQCVAPTCQILGYTANFPGDPSRDVVARGSTPAQVFYEKIVDPDGYSIGTCYSSNSTLSWTDVTASSSADCGDYRVFYHSSTDMDTVCAAVPSNSIVTNGAVFRFKRSYNLPFDIGSTTYTDWYNGGDDWYNIDDGVSWHTMSTCTITKNGKTYEARISKTPNSHEDAFENLHFHLVSASGSSKFGTDRRFGFGAKNVYECACDIAALVSFPLYDNTEYGYTYTYIGSKNGYGFYRYLEDGVPGGGERCSDMNVGSAPNGEYDALFVGQCGYNYVRKPDEIGCDLNSYVYGLKYH